ncbi:hypothetical protein BC829DRAFT_486678 [Chytridium lagenaria]|nr:hypothetical protein BC829DRAFT_486678 [Chytridium lagenaria]
MHLSNILLALTACALSISQVTASPTPGCAQSRVKGCKETHLPKCIALDQKCNQMAEKNALSEAIAQGRNGQHVAFATRNKAKCKTAFEQCLNSGAYPSVTFPTA